MRIFKGKHATTGSALVLVILLTLVLSALAIVALRNVSRSVQQTSVFRTRGQAQMTSSSSANLFAERAGDKAATYVRAIKQEAFSTSGTTSGVYGGSGDMVDKIATATAGGYLLLTDDELKNLVPTSDQNTTALLEQTGLFTSDPSTFRTFETTRSAQFRVVMRDLVDGIPAPGYSDRYSFKKATIATEARVGEADDDWTAANNVAFTRHAKEVLLGPMDQ